jgi:hypothetical protein
VRSCGFVKLVKCDELWGELNAVIPILETHLGICKCQGRESKNQSPVRRRT